jgi:hypothetical protein
VCLLGYIISDRTVDGCDRDGGHWQRAGIKQGSWSDVCVAAVNVCVVVMS